MFEFEEDLSAGARIKAVGIGGGGGNAINTMMRSRLPGVDFIALNTDVQALKQNEAPVRIQIGKQLTKGLSTGANPEIGRAAALEDAKLIKDSLVGCDLVFILACLGGGTGTGAAPVIARLAREENILTVAVVTKPFSFEGRRRSVQAEAGIKALKEEADVTMVIANDNLLGLADKNMPMIDGFKMVDNILLQAVRGISDPITMPGLISVDFAAVNSLMRKTGMAIMGTAVARGEDRAIQAARQAISSPVLGGKAISGATGILLNITGPNNMTLFEVSEACKLIQQEVPADANIVFGSVIDERLQGEISVTLIATGFSEIGVQTVKDISPPYRPPLSPTAATIRDVVEDLAAERAGMTPRTWGEEGIEKALDQEPPLASETVFNGTSLLEMSGVTRSEPVKEMISKQQVEFKQSLRDLSNMSDHDDDKYEIPAFIRRRAD